MFYIYDLIIIRQATFGNYLQAKNGYWARATTDIARLSGDDLHRAADEFMNGEKISNPPIYSLITNMRIISSFNPEFFGEKMRFRNLIFGKIGIPLVWFTLNPKDIGNILVVKLADEEVLLDDTGVKSVLLRVYNTDDVTPTRFCLACGELWRYQLDSEANVRLCLQAPSTDLHSLHSQGNGYVSLGQQFASETPGTAIFTMPDDMSLAQFQEALNTDSIKWPPEPRCIPTPIPVPNTKEKV
ncbi:uncharacterized protein BP5553_04731 [Venustampulla echinocandica]|uniref:Helitron helicase-like domain-containing protein n=1 Tax=Venustampulla echinocandica TaxID=2656787 RepID=A0A370TP74_9HELO|nr:uncharacterized protein BP5553_04731 [Venustampulla echinocandica]RDL37298.1 hypothetical protein BP5553_04731 [Venustampulla echinocandica]